MSRNSVQHLDEFRLPDRFRGRNSLTVLLWQFVQGTLFAWSPQPFYGWRRALLRLFGAKVGVLVVIRPTVRVTYPWKIAIGDRAWIGDNVELYSLGPIDIGADAVVSQRSYLCTGSHDYRDRSFPIFQKPIRVGSGAWIAADVFVAPGVTIGDGAVIGARSSVFHDIPQMAIARGTPAEQYSRRRQEVPQGA